MGARARGFLLFSFAFSSVLSSPEVPASSPAPLNSSSPSSACLVAGAPCVEKREVKYDASATSEDIGMEKRARVGFTGMRGKKDVWDGEEEGGREDLNGFLADLILEKRARSMGFNGMRGRKRGPMAFHGMRGKKADEFEGYGYEPEPDYEDGGAEESLGGDAWEKRTMAFHRMRGRRRQDGDVTRTSLFDERDGDGVGYQFKRAMGFLGMRGKKSPEMWSWDEYNKRGVSSGFFGMKGKKAQSGFFGMRGKKSGSQAYASAPGERGPSSETDPQALSSLAHGVIAAQDRVRRGTSWLRNSKKAKNAFFAVRGKKSPRLISAPSPGFDIISSGSE